MPPPPFTVEGRRALPVFLGGKVGGGGAAAGAKDEDPFNLTSVMDAGGLEGLDHGGFFGAGGGGGGGAAVAFGDASARKRSGSTGFLAPATSVFDAHHHPPHSAAAAAAAAAASAAGVAATALEPLFGALRTKRGTSWLGTPPH